MLIGPAWYRGWAAWNAIRIWKPPDSPISLAPGHGRGAEVIFLKHQQRAAKVRDH